MEGKKWGRGRHGGGDLGPVEGEDIGEEI